MFDNMNYKQAGKIKSHLRKVYRKAVINRLNSVGGNFHEGSSNADLIFAMKSFFPGELPKLDTGDKGKYVEAYGKWLHKKQKAACDTRKAYVYFIGVPDRGTVKIGYSQNLKQRFLSLQTSSPYELYVYKILVDKTPSEEKELHRRFKKYRIRGEWFNCTGELDELLDEEPIRFKDFLMSDEWFVNE